MYSIRAVWLLAFLFGCAATISPTSLQAEPWFSASERQTAEAQEQANQKAAFSRQELRQLRELNPLFLLKSGLGPQAGCLAIALYHEARGETQIGQLAVARVILNRVKSTKYPSTICGVVFQNTHRRNRCQFSFACDGRADTPKNRNSWAQITALTKSILCLAPCTYSPRQDPLMSRLKSRFHRASHYHTVRVRPLWSRRLNRSGRIGRHIFYVSKRVWS